MKTIKKQLKRAFTIVELVIVIAVVAALAAILVPTFVNVVNSANESADEQVVYNMNIALAADEVLHGKPDTIGEVWDVLDEAGYNSTFSPSLKENKIYWNVDENRLVLYNTESQAVTYPEEYTSITNIASGDFIELSTGAVNVSTVADFTAAIEESGSVILSSDITVSSTLLNESSATYIDLNGHTLTNSYNNGSSIEASNGNSIYIANGTYVESGNYGSTSAVFSASSNSSITLEDVTVESSGAVLFPYGSAARIIVKNCTITTSGAYCVGTNSGTQTNYGVSIQIENSTLTAKGTGDDSCTVMINVEGTLDISDSTIIGARQGVVVRAGTATITNTTISCSVDEKSIDDYSDMYQKTNMTYNNKNKIWGGGNEVAMGAVVVGNNYSGNSYLADAKLTMSGCELSYTITDNTNTSSDYSQYNIALFVVANNTNAGTSYSTTVSLSNCTFNGKVVKYDFSTQTIETNNSCTCNLTGYPGEVCTKWVNSVWA